ncbi:PLP-dependent aminotransferase family protein [Sphingomonas cavernae]|uniref:PLP-dependent aminotransferase family protein n=1 Tax=Sphingomonas cavernae TaxID=2320861 RepID=A0A418WNV6_9SPHN|nr:PLP-dependent aminotransferase family protein [Sphingomonas cavernae]RJF92916.1 PLP-dependent aminotransferase family protein [Sphingomonas cavernae]
MLVRSIGIASLVRQLGAWRGAGRGSSGYRQLADALRLLILDGRLPLGIRIPGERDLAAALDVSRTMVSAAFAILRDEGYLVSVQGSGSRTSVPTGAAGRPPAVPDYASGDVIDLAVAALPAGAGVHRAYAGALAGLPAHLPGHGYEPVGLDVLREAVAARYTARACPTEPGQIMVTHGAQHGLALILRLLAGPGDRVVIDHPTYPHAIDAIQRVSCRAVPVGLPAQGWDIEAMVAAFRQASPRLAYLLPDFHNPTGRCMDAAPRAELVAAAARTQTVLVIDETLADLWLDTPSPAPVATHDSGDWVITLGSTGKSYWGGLRIGWIRASARTIAALGRVRASLDLGTPVLEQIAAATLLTEGDADLAERRAELRLRRAKLQDLLGAHLPDWRIQLAPGGLSLWAEMPARVSTALAAVAEGHGVRVTAGPRFGVDGSFERFVRIPYTQPEAMLEKGIARLAAAYRGVTEPRHRSTVIGLSKETSAVF